MIAFNVPNDFPTPLYQSRKVMIVHAPYRHRGGEEHHVETLFSIYESLGWQPRLIPENRDSSTYEAGDILRSLSGKQPEIDFSGIDLVHLHNIYPVLGPSFLRRLSETKIPVIWTVHNHRFYCTNGLALYGGKRCEICKNDPSTLRPIWKNCNSDLQKSAYYSLALNQVRREGLLDVTTRFLAPSPYIADEIQQMGVKAERIRVFPNPIFSDREGKPLAEPLAEARRKIVFAGRLSLEKGVEVLPGLARELSEYDFEIYGDGPEMPKLKAIAHGLDNLHFHGSVAHDEVMKAIRTASAGVLPSICNEICPTFAIEALAQGVPVYLHETVSTRWLVERFGAIGVSQSEAGEFAKVIRACPPSPVKETHRTDVQKTFSLDAYRRNLENLLTELTKGTI